MSDVVTANSSAKELAHRLGYEFVDDVAELVLDPSAWELIPARVMARHHAVPVGSDGKVVTIVMSDPTNVIALDDIRTITGLDLRVLVAERSEIDELVSRVERLDRSAQELLEQVDVEEEDKEADLDGQEAPIVKAINRIIAQAVRQRASDIHLEPQQGQVRIRYRIDGVLTEAMTTRRSLHAGMTSRLKVMADLDIAERRLPQDGRMTVKVEGRAIDLRVASLPTVWGEKVVLRILDRTASVKGLEELGFDEHTLGTYWEACTRPHGAILVTGPTGSGKSTTLYATLERVNSETRNVVTVEDPVEARISGITQIQVLPKAGLTFASALPAILRADPDVVMVGEMRDRSTAIIGVEAALTGHLVFSTLHTNDAASAITRLIEMGIEPFLVASALECVVAQRLARRLCEKCAEPYEPSPAEAETIIMAGLNPDTLHRPQGCAHCSQTGYRGRVVIAEVMRMTDEIRALTVERRSAEDIKREAVHAGMKPLRIDGLRKVLAGITSMEEVLRVVM